jgi:Tfp pilus assembly protein PilO
VSLTARDKKILIVLVPVAVLAAFWFLLLSPKREEAATAATELTQQEDRLDAARQASRAAEGAQQNFETTYAQVVRLGKAIPSTVDMPSLLVQLDAAAAGTGIQFTNITAGQRTVAAPLAAASSTGTGSESRPVEAGGETAQSAPGSAVETANNAAQTSEARSSEAEQTDLDTQTSTSTSGRGLPVGGGAAPAGSPAAGSTAPGLETVPLQLEFEGNFFNLADFFHSVKRFVRVANQDVLVSGRLLTVEGVSWTSDPEIFPRLTAQVNATIYLSPQAQGVTAGATPQGPAPTTPAGTTPPAGVPSDPVVAPTATATP